MWKVSPRSFNKLLLRKFLRAHCGKEVSTPDHKDFLKMGMSRTCAQCGTDKIHYPCSTEQSQESLCAGQKGSWL